ncbi:MAG: hypothetical protein ACERKZ_10380 [Lachnotalea sp.]
MKMYLKFIVAILVFTIYYVIVSAIEEIDLGDPWNKLIKWVHKK